MVKTMICIDFQGGAHGNFLEFVCNKLAGVESAENLPFNQLGAAHKKKYIGKNVFVADHYSFWPKPFPDATKKIVSIQITADDLLPLSQISILRAGNHGIDNDQLEINTYHKLNNKNYKKVLDNIYDSFFANQIHESYNAVKESDWPDVYTMADFEQLPSNIKQQCLQQHRLDLMQFDELHPDCPRHILREFFQIGFENPSMSGFITEQKKMVYIEKDVYVFPFSCFYDTNLFIGQCKKIVSWANVQFNDYSNITVLHKEFVKRQPYAQSKQKCDQLIAELIVGNTALPKLTLMEEAYVNAQLKIQGHEQIGY
jgi:hypothetical protein